MTQRVFAWITTLDACWWYRIKLPLEELRRAYGWEVAWGFELPADVEQSYDVVIGQRLAGDNPRWLELCRNGNVLTVYDMDDDLLSIDPENAVPYSIYAPLVDRTRELVIAADVVTVCTPHVRDTFREFHRNVHEVPICVTRDQLATPQRPTGAFTVGWAGSPFHAQDWHELRGALDDLHTRRPNVAFHFMGATYASPGLPARVTGLQPVDQYVNALDFTVGLAPLAKTPHNRGKSHTKPLEYGVRGVPVIATRWGQYVDWVVDGGNGYLVDSRSDWVDVLTALTDDEAHVRALSAGARETAARYTIDLHIDSWKRAYEGAIL